MIRISIGLIEHENRKLQFTQFETTNLIITQVQTMLIVCVSMFYIRADKVASIAGCTINYTVQYIAFINMHITDSFSVSEIIAMFQRYLLNICTLLTCQIIYMFVLILMLNADYYTFLKFLYDKFHQQ